MESFLPRPVPARFDSLAITISGLCLVHCVATVMFVGAMSSAGALLGSPLVHEIGLVVAILLGIVALGRGVVEHRKLLPVAVGGLGLGMMAGALVLPHGGFEALATMAGVSMLAAGHYMNRLALA